jgi:hypothetical protein
MRSSQTERNFKVNLKHCRTNTIKHASYSYSNTQLDHPYPGFQIQRNKERRRLGAIKQEISKYHCITREPEALLNIYSQSLALPSILYKNGKIAYIYPKPITVAKLRLIIKNITSGCLLADCTYSLWTVVRLCQMQSGSYNPAKELTCLRSLSGLSIYGGDDV